MLKLSFYADKAGHYYNRHFCFHLKSSKDVPNMLLLFIGNGNVIRAAFVEHLLTHHSHSYKHVCSADLNFIFEEARELEVSSK